MGEAFLTLQLQNLPILFANPEINLLQTKN
jgi:hypothetical protein